MRPGPDGRPRCPWAYGAAELLGYHDAEWGRPVADDDGVFERLCLEAFQCGLSWLVVLRKRAALRASYDGFAIERVAAYDDTDVARLLADPALVRNRAKVRAVIANARAAAGLPAGLAALAWSFAPGPRPAPRRPAEVPARTPESAALAGELRRSGFRFVGPTTAYALMQALGMVDDHLAGCVGRRAPAARARVSGR